MMQFKSARGVQQHDVSDAADALIADGLRPTIERVRQKMGRGSPNTVSPMLDNWFAALGERLLGNQSVTMTGAIPGPVQEGMNTLWSVALASGREEAALQTAQLKAHLDNERIALAAQTAEMVQRAQLQAERMQAHADAVDAAKLQIEDFRRQYADARKSLKERETQLGEQRARIDASEHAHAVQTSKAADEAAHQARERDRADERAASTERRLLQEVDRARQETRLLRLSAAEVEKRHALQQTQWEETMRIRSSELGFALGQSADRGKELLATQAALATAHLEAEELTGRSDKQQLANERVVAQLTRALTNKSRPSTPVSGARMKKGKFKSTVGRIKHF